MHIHIKLASPGLSSRYACPHKPEVFYPRLRLAPTWCIYLLHIIKITCTKAVSWTFYPKSFRPGLSKSHGHVQASHIWNSFSASVFLFQQLSTNGWENVSVLFSQPGESTIRFQPGGSDKNFSREGLFCLAKKEGLKKRCSGAHSGRRKIIKFPGKAEARNLEQASIMFTSSIMLYALSCILGGKFPQNRYFEERSLTALDVQATRRPNQ